MKKLVVILLALAMGVCSVACTQQTPTAEGTAPPTAEANPPAGEPAAEPTDEPSAPENNNSFTAILCSDSAGAPYSQLVWRGFETISTVYGSRIKFVEALEAAAYEQQLRALAEQGVNPIYCMYDEVGTTALEICDEYPDTFFCLVDSSIEAKAANVCQVGSDSYEPSFISGALAAYKSETGTVGWIGCYDSDVVNRYRDGFSAGVAWVNETYNKDVKMLVTHLGDAVDTVKGSEAAKIFINFGADVVCHAANSAGIGVLQAAKEAGILSIGCDSWQGDINDSVFWSTIMGTYEAVFKVYVDFVNGELVAGRYILGIKDGNAIYDARDYSKLNADEQTMVDLIVLGITNGSLNIESYNQY